MIGSQDTVETLLNTPHRNTLVVHSHLEILLINREETIAVLDHLVDPSLQFLGVYAWGLGRGTQIIGSLLVPFFQRSRLDSIAISLKGSPSRHFFAGFINALPAATRLHLSIECDDDDDSNSNNDSEEVGCGHMMPFKPGTVKEILCPSFLWLKAGITVARQGSPVPIYLYLHCAHEGPDNG